MSAVRFPHLLNVRFRKCLGPVVLVYHKRFFAISWMGALFLMYDCKKLRQIKMNPVTLHLSIFSQY